MTTLFWLVMGVITGVLASASFCMWQEGRQSRRHIAEALALTEEIGRHPARRVPPEDRDDWPPAGVG